MMRVRVIVCGESVVFLAHEVEVVLGHKTRILYSVVVIENELCFLAVETVGVEGCRVDLGTPSFATYNGERLDYSIPRGSVCNFRQQLIFPFVRRASTPRGSVCNTVVL